ncbi:aminotransferase class V-fold PLP-dependent enzyme [Candidatus Zixiibacteriota bacterium]
MWQEFRSHFPIFEDSVYLNTCSLGALSRQSREAVERFLDLWQEMGASAWYELWLGEIELLRERVARLLGCGMHEIALMPNVSSGLSAIGSALDYRERNRVICAELDFPTLPYQWHSRARDGAEVIFAESRDGLGIPESDYEILLNDRTALLAVGHVFFTTGWTANLGTLAEMAHDAGALMLVDAYQSAGIIPLPVKELGIDILLAGGLKWLLGGPGIAWCYISEDIQEQFDPRATGWFGVEDQFDFNPTQRTLRKDARRLEAGTPSPASVYAARAGLDLVLDHGVEVLGARVKAMIRLLKVMAEERGIEVQMAGDETRWSGISVLPDEDPYATVKALAEEGVIVDARPTGVRVSPYAYNTPLDIEILLDAILKIRSS